MRPCGSPKPVARRRRRAVALLQQGLSMREVARRVQASVSSVSPWQAAWRPGGDAALAPKPVPGPSRQLTDQPGAQVLPLLGQGARAQGFANELWTLKRMAAVMHVHCGVRYHPSHLWTLWRRLGWSGQVPDRRALPRDDEAMAHGKRYTWPAIQKSPTTWGPSRLSG
jgi:transposase